MPTNTTTAAAATCEACAGTGWVPPEPKRGERVSRCPDCRVKQTVAPGVPLEFKDAILETCEETAENRHALRFGRKWIGNDQRRDLFIFGPVGTGKTRLACALLNELFQQARIGQFARVPMMLLRLQPTDGEHDATFWRYCETPLLVLDDLGAERETATDFTRRTLLMIYEERCDRGLWTIWTSNKDLTALGEFMVDERLVSRIKGRADVLELAGEDWRMRRRLR